MWIAGVTEGHASTTRVCAAIGFLHPEVGKLQMRSWVGPSIMDESDLLSGERVTTSRLRAGRASAYCMPETKWAKQNEQKVWGGKNREKHGEEMILPTNELARVWKYTPAPYWLLTAVEVGLSVDSVNDKLKLCISRLSTSQELCSAFWETLGALFTHLRTPANGVSHDRVLCLGFVFWQLPVCPQISTSVQRAWSSATTTPAVSTCPAGTTASAEVVSMTMAPTCWMGAPALVRTRWSQVFF